MNQDVAKCLDSASGGSNNEFGKVAKSLDNVLFVKRISNKRGLSPLTISSVVFWLDSCSSG